MTWVLIMTVWLSGRFDSSQEYAISGLPSYAACDSLGERIKQSSDYAKVQWRCLGVLEK